jgi:NAD(P)H-nitrite reductase large subunit
MTHFTHLIIGRGMAAAAAIGGMRDIDPHSSIGLISAEPHPPYKRPPLSKGLWKGLRYAFASAAQSITPGYRSGIC